MPSRMRLSAPTEGFIWLDSISEIVELVTPERFASSRCDSLWRARTKRSRPPISTLIAKSLLQVFRIEQICLDVASKINGLQERKKRTCCGFPSVARWYLELPAEELSP